MTQTRRTVRHAHAAPIRRAFTLVELVIVIGLILLLVAITVTVSVGVMHQSEARETENAMIILDNALGEWLLQERRDLTYGRGANHTGVTNGEPCNVGEVYQLPQLRSANQEVNDEQDALTFSQQETDFLIATLLQRPVFEEMIASMESRFIQRVPIDPDAQPEGMDIDMSHFGNYPEFGNVEYIYRFVDAWDRPILAIHPGREFARRCRDGTPNPDSDYCFGTGSSERCADDDGTIRTPLENVFGVGENRRIYFVSGGPSERFGHLHLDKAINALTGDDKTRIERAGDNIYTYPVMIDQARPQ